MALDFPASPVLNQTFAGPGGTMWIWDSTKWIGGSAVPGGAIISDTPPSLNAGGLWWDSVGGQLYVRFDDGVGAPQWVTAANMTGMGNAATKTDVAAANNSVGRNLVHNGLFNVAQRGTGAFSASGYTLDRWAFSYNSDTGVSVSRFAFTVSGMGGADEDAGYVMTTVFTGAAAAGAYTLVYQPIEGVKRLANKTVTVSFWASNNASAATKLGVSLSQNFGTGGSPSAQATGIGQSVTVTASYARYSLTFTIPSIAGKVLGTAANDSTQLEFWYSCGSNYTARSGVGQQSGQISIYGVQLEIGSIVTPLEKPDPELQLRQCMRFYQTYVFDLQQYGAAGNGFGGTFWLPVMMRALPAVTITGMTYANASNASGVAWAAGVANITVVATAAGYARGYGTAVMNADL